MAKVRRAAMGVRAAVQIRNPFSVAAGPAKAESMGMSNFRCAIWNRLHDGALMSDAVRSVGTRPEQNARLPDRKAPGRKSEDPATSAFAPPPPCHPWAHQELRNSAHDYLQA